MLITAETFYNPDGILGAIENRTHTIPVSHYAAWRHTGGGLGRDYTVPSGDADDNAVEAFVERGMWMAQCPKCNSAQVTSPADPRFICVGDPTGCGNYYVGGKTVPVKWPKNREAIEAALITRPQLFRNWRPGETVKDLIRENKEHGLVNT